MSLTTRYTGSLNGSKRSYVDVLSAKVKNPWRHRGQEVLRLSGQTVKVSTKCIFYCRLYLGTCFHTPSITEKRTVRGKPEGLSISSEQLDFDLQKLPTFPLSYKANRTRTVRGKPWGLSNLYCSSNSNAVVHFRS